MPPKREERGVAIPQDGGVGALEGIFVAGGDAESGGAIVAPPHPLYGGSMDSPVVTEIAWACQQAGLATLRFNWRGVGASAGAPSGDPQDGAADYAASLAHLADTVEGPLVACGYSFGAATAVAVAARSPRIRRLVLVAPPVAMLDVAVLEAFPGSMFLLSGDRDPYAPPDQVQSLADTAGRARCVVVPGADHFFVDGLAEIGLALGRWLGR